MPECQPFLKRIFPASKFITIRAPEKPIMPFDPDDFEIQRGFFHEVRYDPNTKKPIPYKVEVIRAIPNSHSPFGRYLMSLEKKETAFFFNFDHFDRAKSSGYFSKRKVFQVTDPDELVFGNGHIGKAIVMPGGQIDHRTFAMIIRHEGYHAYNEWMRGKGFPTRFDYVIKPADGKEGILGTDQFYKKGIHAEEIHTFTKDFINKPVIAHHRETLALIRENAKRLPASLPQAEKYNRIRIEINSVLDEDSYITQLAGLKKVLEIHQQNLKEVEVELIKKIEGIKTPDLVFDETKKEKLILKTSNTKIQFNDINANDVMNRPQIPLRRIRSMRTYNRVMQDRVNEFHRFKRSIDAKGFFTANDYLEYKNRLSELSRLVYEVKVPE